MSLKLVVNIGMGRLSSSESKLCLEFLSTVSGQKPVITKAKKSISNFSVRKGMISGCKVTLRNQKAINFLRKVVLFILPVESTFKGLTKKCLQDRVLNFGIKNVYAFPEVEESPLVKGMNLTMIADNHEDLLEILKEERVPFKD